LSQLDALRLVHSLRERLVEFSIEESYLRDDRLRDIVRRVWSGPPSSFRISGSKPHLVLARRKRLHALYRNWQTQGSSLATLWTISTREVPCRKRVHSTPTNWQPFERPRQKGRSGRP